MSVVGWIAIGLVALIGVCSAFDRQDSLGNFHGEGVNVWAIAGGAVFVCACVVGMFVLGWL